MKIRKSVLLMLLILSCQGQSSKNRFLQQISDYPKSIIDHFPKEVKGMYRTAVIADIEHDVTSIMLLNQYEDSQYFRIKDSLIQLSHVKYSPEDTCLLVLNMYSNETNFFNSFKTYDETFMGKECLKNKLPVPNFWPLDMESNTVANLPGDFDIHVFEAKDEIIDNKYLSKNVYMPEYWAHGYSKGVATNDKAHEIIYWFILW